MTEYETITPERIAALEAKARRMQSEAFREAVRSLIAWVRGIVAGASARKDGRTA